MVRQIEGSRAVAEAVAMCRPRVICAYPITPQTRIVEALGAMVKKGELNARFLNVESEFAAMSAVIGAEAAGARAYTATACQGLLCMSEAVRNAAGLGLPVVMTVANRTIGAPINIWNDHGDAMSQRDAGWIQLYAETSQEAADLHIQAFRIAEELSNPVMVCLDGFLLTHASERIDLPEQGQVDAFLPPCVPRQVLDPHERMRQALELIPAVEADFGARFGRGSGGLVKLYRTDDADLIVVALGSVLSTVKDTIDELRDDGMRVGAFGITTFRPFPAQAVRDALGDDERLRRLVVLERSLAAGTDGVVTADLRTALGTGDGGPRDSIVSTVVSGPGGRPVTRDSLRRVLTSASRGALPPFSFLGLGMGLVG
jgi:pyruvate ferredoxin oxidoreductase alpha subunit